MSDSRRLGKDVFETVRVVRPLMGLAVCITLFSAHTVQAEGLKDRIIAGLVAEGFTEITVKRTLLGRSRIVALQGNQMREIVLNPTTEVVLRDYVREVSTHSGSPVMTTHSERDENEDARRPPPRQEPREPDAPPSRDKPAKPLGPPLVTEDGD